jgi:hypothetical protein
MVPLQFGGVPGGIELLVIGLVFLLLFGIPLVVVVVVGVLWLRSRGTDDGTEQRVAELEREVERLREQLDDTDERTDPAGDAPAESDECPPSVDGVEVHPCLGDELAGVRDDFGPGVVVERQANQPGDLHDRDVVDALAIRPFPPDDDVTGKQAADPHRLVEQIRRREPGGDAEIRVEERLADVSDRGGKMFRALSPVAVTTAPSRTSPHHSPAVGTGPVPRTSRTASVNS